MSVNTSAIVKWYYNDLIWRVASSDKVFLTFDDGPTPGVTDSVLDILNSQGVKATFFCLGKNVSICGALFKRIIDEGHAVGNHSQNHPNGWKTKTEDYLQDVEKAQEYISSSLFRPPYGRIRRKQIKSLLPQYKIIMWDVLSGDYHPKTTPNTCVNRVVEHTRKGSIIVFHDSEKAKKNVLTSLPEIIEKLKKKGFEFDKITG